LSGTVRSLEYHGHEWLARVDADVTVVDAAALGAPARPRPLVPPRPAGPVERALSLLRGRRRAPLPEPPAHVGAHRRSDVLVRLHTRDGCDQGSPVHLAVDLDRVLVFDGHGRRVDPVTR